MEDGGSVYTIIVDGKGAGKTSAMASVLREKKGVVAMLVPDNGTPESLISQLIKECRIEVK